MSTSNSEGVDEDEDTGVVGKTVKVSILQHLQSFRYSKSPAGGTAGVVRRVPKIQHLSSSKDTGKVSNEASQDGVMCPGIDESLDNVSVGVNDREVSLLNESIAEGSPSEAIEMEVLSVPDCTSDVSVVVSDVDKNVASRENIIRPINRDVVHQICSGQVIVTLSTAVKELVENSLDAGATKIDIRLVEHGSKLVEVSDDASGIEEINFEGLALKHHTSKIAEFEDLTTISTFGFRGEALSSLCALANLTVTTRHKESEQRSGYKLEYDYNGRITSKVRCARDFGTSVVLKDLFHTLPVRHKEFNKNLKKDYHRMVNVLYGYCLVVDRVRITCTNQVGNGVPQKVLAVPAYNSMKERIVTLFGSKQLASLIQIKRCEEISDEILEEFGLNQSTFEQKYELEGYISKPNHGRSSNDRQFYFINSRPCEPAKISRVINEVYHTFSRQQNPFVCLHIKTSTENVDVNVTPDKRTLYVQNEKILLTTIKASLVPLLTAAASSYNPNNSLSSSQLQLNFTGSSHLPSHDDSTSMCLSTTFEIKTDASSQKGRHDNEGGFDEQYSTSTTKLPGSVMKSTDNFIKSFSRGPTRTIGGSGCPSRAGSFSSNFKRVREDEKIYKKEEIKQPKLAGYLKRFEVVGKKNVVETRTMADEIEMEVEDFQENDHPNFHGAKASIANSDDSDEGDILYDDEIEIDNNEFLSQRRSVSIRVNWKAMFSKANAAASHTNETEPGTSTKSYSRKFRAKILPEDNSVAEDELKKQLTKDMFPKMEIIGQFNLGFIVVKIGPDLFIVDQHASDEKYNYEDLEKSTVLNGQLLISPLDLDLPAISENIIMDNIEIFQKNGFDFIISPDEEPRKRVKMLKIPFSKNVEFGKSDVDELIFMLEDASSGKSFYRPTKVREMFASRACRKSVMIGTALNGKEMRLIVDHMGEMEQPWNCPHGRPTIRHLINLNLLPDLDLSKFNH